MGSVFYSGLILSPPALPALTLILPSALKGNSRKSVCDILYNPVPTVKEWLVTPARTENRSQHMSRVHAYSLHRMPARPGGRYSSLTFPEL